MKRILKRIPGMVRARSLGVRLLQTLRKASSGDGEAVLPTYPEWLEERVRARGVLFPASRPRIDFSILTTVYEKTNADLFRELWHTLAAQTYPFAEWVVLAHGPVLPALDAALDKIAKDQRVRLLRHSANLGIIGGMRVCLMEASGAYVVPVDADDLLTPDALQVVASVIHRLNHPAFLYSDEDLLVDDRPHAPYWRPDWDPVLNMASSYIWHLCAIRRDAALKAEVYTNADANWCHDWDTVFRILKAGHEPVHIPEILYHWRQHPASSTNRPDPEKGSMFSTRKLLESGIARTAAPMRYEVGLFPIFRGADEWYILRRQTDPTVMDGVVVGASEPCVPAKPSLLRRVHACPEEGDPVAALERALDRISAPLVVVRHAATSPPGDDGLWEAMKLFELHPEVSLVCGRILDGSGRIVAGGESYDEMGRLVNPDVGRQVTDPGFFALALKPQCVGVVPSDLFVARTDVLRHYMARRPPGVGWTELGVWLGVAALKGGTRVAMSPLIQTQLFEDQCTRQRPDQRSIQALLEHVGLDLRGRIVGSCRFVMAREWYRPA